MLWIKRKVIFSIYQSQTMNKYKTYTKTEICRTTPQTKGLTIYQIE